MKEIKLKVLHKNIEQRIQIYTYYTGEARKEIGIPERLAAQMQVSSDDSTQLSDHIGNAIAELGNLISRYFAICSIEELFDQETNSKLYIFTLPMPAFSPKPLSRELKKYGELCCETCSPAMVAATPPRGGNNTRSRSTNNSIAAARAVCLAPKTGNRVKGSQQHHRPIKNDKLHTYKEKRTATASRP